jgi:branched-chain amino acid transport system substrate-binding protein
VIDEAVHAGFKKTCCLHFPGQKKEKRTMKRGYLSPLAIFLFGALILAGPFPSAAAEKPIKIGCLIPLTGPYAMWGKWQANNIRFALEEVGYQIAGRPVEVIIEDEGGLDVNLCMDKTKKLIGADKVDVIFGPFHAGSHMAVSPYLSSLPMVNVVYIHSDRSKESLMSKYCFIIAPILNDTSIATGAYAYEEMGVRTVSVLRTDSISARDFLAGFVDSFTKRGGKIVQEQLHPPRETDFTPYLTNLKPADAFVDVTLGTPAELALWKQYGELGLFKKMKPIIGKGGSLPQSVLPQLGDQIVGMIGSQGYLPTLDNPENKAYLEAYMKKYPEEPPDDKCVYARIATQVTLAAIKRNNGNTHPDALKKALLEVEINTPAGQYKFNPGRVGIQDYYVTEVQKVDGKLQWVKKKTLPQMKPSDTTYP